MAFTAYSALSFKSLLHPEPIKHHPSLPQLPTHKPISAVHAADPSKPSGTPQPTFPTQPKWSLGSWKAKKALQLPEYPDQEELASVLGTLETFPPIVFAGEARSLEEKLGQAAMGQAFLLQGGDCAESFKEFNANNIRDTFRVLLQMGVVLMFGGQMPVIKVMIAFVSRSCSFLVFKYCAFFFFGVGWGGNLRKIILDW